ncbi:hypothetical protein EV421DRAFT_40091 [Armillaria borealis]|uniref:Uncharacterized protein n=1 Tax=Armillaria borealis TaxID=47425 RepID=A0AA39K7X6_9AGAR|nr:hypothetical protein EV421DRAFT_40091 [Armillaria borealis]
MIGYNIIRPWSVASSSGFQLACILLHIAILLRNLQASINYDVGNRMAPYGGDEDYIVFQKLRGRSWKAMISCLFQVRSQVLQTGHEPLSTCHHVYGTSDAIRPYVLLQIHK